MTEKKLDSVDITWLRLDRPENPMMITGLIVFEKPLEYTWLKKNIEATIAPFPRFHQRLVQPKKIFRRAFWQDDPGFDIDQHINCINLLDPMDESLLIRFINDQLDVPLDELKALWHFDFIENYQDGCALVARIHHTIADGISLMQVLLMAFSKTESAEGELAAGQASLLERNRRRRMNKPGKWQQVKAFILHPGEWVRHARYGAALVIALLRLAFRRPDPRSFLKSVPGTEKRATWSHPIKTEEIRGLSKCFNCTVNDVLASLIAGAIGRYFELRGEPVDNVVIRSFILVNMRPLELDEELGNKFGIVYLTMPLGIRDPQQRLAEMKRNMDELKGSSEAAATYFILRLLGHLPASIQALATRFFDSKGSLIMTNVPGPKHPLYLAHSRVKTIMAWVPQSGRLGLGFSVVSYDGEAIIGISADSGMVPDPGEVLNCFYEELDSLRALQPE